MEIEEARLTTHRRSSAIGRWKWQDQEDRQGRQDLKDPEDRKDLGARADLGDHGAPGNRRDQHDRSGRAAR